jgi:hypothetical protein
MLAGRTAYDTKYTMNYASLAGRFQQNNAANRQFHLSASRQTPISAWARVTPIGLARLLVKMDWAELCFAGTAAIGFIALVGSLVWLVMM